MSDEQILEILKKFSDYLEVANMTSYVLRWMGWIFIQGLAFFVDGLENITNEILGIKLFFHNEGIQEFVRSIQPFLYVILGFSFLYVGYMIILNRKINREQIATNLFISIVALTLLNSGIQKADTFTDRAINAVSVGEQGSISEKVIKDGITDIAQFDVTGWSNTELKKPNTVPEENIKLINITEEIDGDFEISKDKKISDKGGEILDHQIALDGMGNVGIESLDNGWFDFFKQKYYRWHFDFSTIVITLLVTGLTLFLISVKLAKLCYELAFNYILAIIVAPGDIANGQMLKEILKRILNTFLIIIMIFISMKVYLIGTEYISKEFDGIAYLVALIAISLAVVDGPVMCERLFGIDAGLKNSWQTVAGTAAGAVAAGKAISGASNGLKSLFPKGGQADNKKNSLVNGNSNGKPEGKPSLHDEMKEKQNEGLNDKRGVDNKNAEKDQEGKQEGVGLVDNMKGKPADLESEMNNDKDNVKAVAASSLEDEMKASGFDEDNNNENQAIPETSDLQKSASIQTVEEGMKSSAGQDTATDQNATTDQNTPTVGALVASGRNEGNQSVEGGTERAGQQGPSETTAANGSVVSNRSGDSTKHDASSQTQSVQEGSKTVSSGDTSVNGGAVFNQSTAKQDNSSSNTLHEDMKSSNFGGNSSSVTNEGQQPSNSNGSSIIENSPPRPDVPTNSVESGMKNSDHFEKESNRTDSIRSVEKPNNPSHLKENKISSKESRNNQQSTVQKVNNKPRDVKRVYPMNQNNKLRNRKR